MDGQKGWLVAIATLAAVGILTAVLLVGSTLRDPLGRGEHRLALDPSRAVAARLQPTGVARGGRVPPGQPPARALTFPRFQNAFNAEASDLRLLVLLSPT